MKIKGIEYIKMDSGALVPASIIRETVKVQAPENLLPFFETIRYEEQEIMMVITLDGSNQVITTNEVTKGLANKNQVHPREIFKQAVRDNAVCVVLAHNHPSGYVQPSAADIDITKKTRKACEIMGIRFLDHIIVTGEPEQPARNYFSFREEGLI